MTEITWRCAPLKDLTPLDVYRLLDLRAEVFVVEQNCVYRDTDGHDLHPDTLHLLGEAPTPQPGSPRLVAYARLLAPHTTFPEPSIGRVVTSPSARRTGAGRRLMHRALQEVANRWPGPVQIGAQRYLEAWYAEFGFVTVGDPYLEDGIPHVHMVRPSL